MGGRFFFGGGVMVEKVESLCIDCFVGEYRLSHHGPLFLTRYVLYLHFS